MTKRRRRRDKHVPHLDQTVAPERPVDDLEEQGAPPDLSEASQQTEPDAQLREDPPPELPPAPAMGDIAIRFAGPQDLQKIHFFLCLVSRPVLLGPINAAKAWMEIDRILNSKSDFALIAEIGGELVGTLGIIGVDWWYSDWKFMTDRWFFIYPALANKGVGPALLAEAGLIASASNCSLIINGKPVKKNKGAGNGVYFMAHNLVHRQTNEEPVTARH